MKRSLVALAALTFLAAAPVFALDPPSREEQTETRDRDRSSVIDDVIRMTRAGVDDETIIKFVRQSRNQYVVDADVIIALTDAKVSKDVLNVLMDEAYDRGTARAERGRTRTRTVYVRPYYGYSPWYSPFYDPFWYGPRVSFGFGFGGYRGGSHGGHHGGGHHGGGHHGRH
jgi:hypothetical protein